MCKSVKLSDKTTITKPKEILNEEYRFYKELYTSTGACPDDHCFDNFFNNPVLPEISADQRQSCEGLLTKGECLASLKQMAKINLLERMVSRRSVTSLSGIV